MREPGLDVRRRTFKGALRGFNRAEVENALRAVASTYEEARARVGQLEQALADAAAEKERLLQSERSVIRLFQSAEEHARMRIGSANREAARIVEGAEERARTLLAGAEDERARLADEVGAIERRRHHILCTVAELIEPVTEKTAPGSVAAGAPRPTRSTAIEPTCSRPRVEPDADEATIGALVPTDHEDAGLPSQVSAARSTTPRLLVGNNRRLTMAVAAVVLCAAAVASPGAFRWRQLVAGAPVQVQQAGALPTPSLIERESAPIAAPVVPGSPTADSTPAPIAPASAALVVVPESAAAPLVVRLRSSRECWVRVTVDGRAESLTLGPGDEIVRSAEDTIQVRIGDAAAAALEVNGRALPPLGRDGQVIDRVFTADGLSH